MKMKTDVCIPNEFIKHLNSMGIDATDDIMRIYREYITIVHSHIKYNSDSLLNFIVTSVITADADEVHLFI